MLPEFEIRGGARRCAKCDQPLKPSDHYFSLIREERGVLVREDYAAQHWPGPPPADPDVVAWWESKPVGASTAAPMTPNEVLLKLFDQWADEPDQGEARYVLTLLLVRRRVFRIEALEPARLFNPGAQDATAAPPPVLRVYCARRDETYDVPELPPDGARVHAIQQRLSSLLAA